MKLEIEINCDGQAFDEWKAFEVARILRELADRLVMDNLEQGQEWPLRDYNGNRVGQAVASQ